MAGVVALAPWLSGSESVRQPAATPSLIVHGLADRVASAERAAGYADVARRSGAPISFVGVERGEHTMLRRRAAFDTLAADYVVALLDREQVSGRASRLQRLAFQARDQPGDYTV